jgi:chemotaxis response regulator CheB
MAYVLIRHSVSTQEDVLARELEEISPMPLVQALNGTAVKPNHVYLIPPKETMIIRTAR